MRLLRWLAGLKIIAFPIFKERESKLIGSPRLISNWLNLLKRHILVIFISGALKMNACICIWICVRIAQILNIGTRNLKKKLNGEMNSLSNSGSSCLQVNRKSYRNLRRSHLKRSHRRKIRLLSRGIMLLSSCFPSRVDNN